MLILLARLTEVKTYDKTGCNELAKSILEASNNTSYSNIGAVDAEGNNFCSAIKLSEQVNISKLDGFMKTKKMMGFYVGKYRISTINNNEIITASYPIRDVNNDFGGIVFVSFDLRRFNTLAQRVKLPAGYTMTVLDQDATVVARHPESTTWIGKSVRDASFGRALFSENLNEGTFLSKGLDGVDRIYAYVRTNKETGELIVAIGAPQTVPITIADQFFVRDVLILFGVILAAVVIAAFDLHFIFFRKRQSE